MHYYQGLQSSNGLKRHQSHAQDGLGPLLLCARRVTTPVSTQAAAGAAEFFPGRANDACPCGRAWPASWHGCGSWAARENPVYALGRMTELPGLPACELLLLSSQRCLCLCAADRAYRLAQPRLKPYASSPKGPLALLRRTPTPWLRRTLQSHVTLCLRQAVTPKDFPVPDLN